MYIGTYMQMYKDVNSHKHINNKWGKWGDIKIRSMEKGLKLGNDKMSNRYGRKRAAKY